MKLMGFDVEVWGRQPQYGLQPIRIREGEAGVTSYAVASHDASGQITRKSRARPTVEGLRKFLKLTALNRYRLVAWNAPYDIAVLLALGLKEEVYANQWLDGMLVYRHTVNVPTGVERPPLGLKDAVATRWPHRAGYAKDIEHSYDWEHDPEDKIGELLTYNEEDSQYALELTIECWNELSEEQRRCVLIEAACLPMVAEANLEGIAVNEPAAKALEVDLDAQKKLAYVNLKLTDPDGHITPEVLASPKQLADLLYTKWRLPATIFTDKGAPSTDKEALAILAVNDPRAGNIHLYREGMNNAKKFATGALVSADYNGDGRTRPAFRPFATYTGRGSYSSKTGPKGKQEVPTGCALHQWKRGANYRRVIAAPEGYDLLEWDFAGQEYRWMAEESGDPTMIDLCQPGEDAHSYMGGQVGGIDYRKLIELVAADDDHGGRVRQMGKVGNLACQYRMSPPTLQRTAAVQHQMKLTLSEARAIHATYLATYPGVPKYWKNQIKLGKTYGYAETKAGRRVKVPLDWFTDGDSMHKWMAESAMINFPIQGVGGDQKYLALQLLRDYLPTVDGRFYYELHDGLFAIVPKAKSMKASEHVTHMLSNLPYREAWGVNLRVQFPVDAKIGETWGDLKKVKF